MRRSAIRARPGFYAAPRIGKLKLCRETEKDWRKLDGFKFVPLVEAGIKISLT